LSEKQPQSGAQAPQRHYAFGDFVLDTARGALLRDGNEVTLRKQVYEMLVILVERQGELVSKDFLMETIWSDTVVTENSITQCLKEIRQAIHDSELNKIRTVPKRGYIFTLPVIQSDAAKQDGDTSSGNRPAGWLGLAALAVVAIIVWWILSNRPDQPEQATAKVFTPPQNSVAVLPFVSMSPNPDMAYLADGLSEEILNQLAQIPELVVIARTSSFIFRDSDVDVTTIGHQLNVAHVLEGSVRIENGSTRVTVQLVTTDDQAHLWSQSYDRPLDSIFELQEGIAQDVAQELHVTLVETSEGKTKRGYKPVAEAYEAYLRGQYLMAQRTQETIAGAVDEFSKATEIDPNYAAAHANLAITTQLLSQQPYGGLPGDETLARARPHAERALELDPELAEAHAAMAYTLVTPQDEERAFYHFQRAVILKPNYADGAVWLSDSLIAKGRYRESFALLERAVRSDPLSVVAMWNYFTALQARGRLEEAGQVLEKLASLAPGHYRDLLIVLHGQNGQWAEAALTALDSMLEIPGNSWAETFFTTFLAAMGMNENALEFPHVEDHLLYELLGQPQDTVSTYEQLQTDREPSTFQKWIFGEALAAAGDFERALPYLEDNWFDMNGVVAPPWYDAKAALALIAARRAAGENPETEKLAIALQDAARRYRDEGIVECFIATYCVDFETAIADYLSGDHPSAVSLLTKAVSSGYLIPPNSAYLQFLYDDPNMAPVFERQREHMRARKQEFLQAICPDNPYAEVWQPVEGTCDLESTEDSAQEP
jgi:TolB-like protein/DNA-binding winged helix-turn-helix (wHTH) protein/Flp pilus assembly protein TadD